MLADSAATIAFAALALILLRIQPSSAVWPRRVRPLPAPAVRHSWSPALLAVRYPGAARSTIVRCSRCRWLPTTLPASLPPSRCPALRCVACGGGVDRVRYDRAAVEFAHSAGHDRRRAAERNRLALADARAHVPALRRRAAGPRRGAGFFLDLLQATLANLVCALCWPAAEARHRPRGTRSGRPDSAVEDAIGRLTRTATQTWPGRGRRHHAGGRDSRRRRANRS
jgi:hypothetical protein